MGIDTKASMISQLSAYSMDDGKGIAVLYCLGVDASGNAIYGTAGTPSTAVLSIQGVAGGQPVPVSGTVAITAVSLPLPGGAATAANQETQNTSLSTLKAATDRMAASGGGIFIQQDSQGTIAKETGGHLAAAAADLNELTAAPVAKIPLAITPKTVTTPGTAEAIVGSEAYVRSLTLQAKKAAGDNTGNVFIGVSGLDQGVNEMIELEPGQTFTLTAPAGTRINIATLYIDADNAGDGVVGIYIPV
jgi:hypothetical protein